MTTSRQELAIIWSKESRCPGAWTYALDIVLILVFLFLILILLVIIVAFPPAVNIFPLFLLLILFFISIPVRRLGSPVRGPGILVIIAITPVRVASGAAVSVVASSVVVAILLLIRYVGRCRVEVILRLGIVALVVVRRHLGRG